MSATVNIPGAVPGQSIVVQGLVAYVPYGAQVSVYTTTVGGSQGPAVTIPVEPWMVPWGTPFQNGLNSSYGIAWAQAVPGGAPQSLGSASLVQLF